MTTQTPPAVRARSYPARTAGGHKGRRRLILAVVAPPLLYLTPFVLFEAWFYAEKLLNWKARRSVVPQPNRVRFETAPAGASTPSGGLTAPLEASERNGCAEV